MNRFFYSIRSVGFDLDDTLYPKDPRIDDIIRNNIAIKILEKKPELEKIENVRRIYDSEYEKIGSWTKIMKEVGFTDPKEVMRLCLSDTIILDFIKKDEKLVKIINSLNKKYSSFLITSSPETFSIKKLMKIGISPELFKYRFFGDYQGFETKGSVFESFLGMSPFLPEEHVYIGDSLKRDILPAKYAGMKTITIGTQIQEADFSVKKITDIEKLLL
jgi:FMN phosphatase YigB (HAD superfamily)